MTGPVCGQRRVISAYLKPACALPAGHGGGRHADRSGPGPACTWADTRNPGPQQQRCQMNAMPAAADDEPMCGARDEDFIHYSCFTCTRPPDHQGVHAAHGMDDAVVHTWPREAGRDAR